MQRTAENKQHVPRQSEGPHIKLQIIPNKSKIFRAMGIQLGKESYSINLIDDLKSKENEAEELLLQTKDTQLSCDQIT